MHPRSPIILFAAIAVLACDPADDGDPTDGDPSDGERADGDELGVPEANLPKTDFEAAAALAARGRSCGIISEGHWSWEFVPGQFCETLCMLRAGCSAFERFACDLRPVPALEDCFDACDQADVAQCGDGTTIPSEQLCDLQVDCATGEDERHCEPFRCADGRPISPWAQCDGDPDCEGGEDESDCALICGEPRVKT